MNKKLLTTILQRSNELITSESFLMKHHIGNAFTRSGKLSQTTRWVDVYSMVRIARSLTERAHRKHLTYGMPERVCLRKFGMTVPGINDIIKRKLENKEVPHAT